VTIVSEFGLDILLFLMLATTTVWCVLVHRRLGRVALGQRELADFVGTLSEAARKAELAARELRDSGIETIERAREHEDAARKQSDELNRLLATSARVAQRLETSLSDGLRTLADARTLVELSPAKGQSVAKSKAGTPRRAARPRTSKGRAAEKAAPPRPAEVELRIAS
jgi:hypothetical protein